MIVLLLKGKLFQTENIMPFMFALAKYTNKKFLIIYPTKTDYEIIKNNKDIFFALKKIGKVKHLYSTFDLDKRFIHGERKGMWYTILGLFSVLHRYIILFPLLYKQAIIFGIEKLPFTEWILNINKYILKGKRISFLLYPYNIIMLKGEMSRVLSTKNEFMPFKKVIEYNANVLISSYSHKEVKTLSPEIASKYKLFHVGQKLYNWPSWIKALESVSKNEVKLLKGKNYVFFPLSIIKRKMPTPTGIINVDFTYTILQIIEALSKIDKNILVILRPHPSDCVNHIKSLLNKKKKYNVIISNINSTILIKYSLFMVKYGISLMDPKAIYLKKVCIRYQPKFLLQGLLDELEFNKTKNIFDFTNKKKFENFLKKTVSNSKKKKKEKLININEKLILRDFIKFIN